MNKDLLLLGLGGAGCTAVDTYLSNTMDTLNALLINTHKKSLEQKTTYKTLLIGKKSLKGLGAGRAIPLAEKAIDESFDDILLTIKEYRRIIIISGINGGTGGSAGHLAKKLLAHGLKVGISTIYPLPMELSELSEERANIALLKLETMKNKLLFLHVFKVVKGSTLDQSCLSLTEFMEKVDKRFIDETFALIKNYEHEDV